MTCNTFVAMAVLYLVRAMLAAFHSQYAVSLVLASYSFLLVVCYFCTDKFLNYRNAAFLMTLVMFVVEYFLACIWYTGFVRYIYTIPLGIIFISLVSGMRHGLIITVWGSALGILLLQKAPRDISTLATLNHNHQLIDGIFGYLLASEALLVFLLILFQRALASEELETAKQRLIRTQSTKRKMLAETVGNLSHEVNNPIAIIDGAVRLLRRYSSQNLSFNEFETKLNHIVHAEERILRVMDSVDALDRQLFSEPVLTLSLKELLDKLAEILGADGVGFERGTLSSDAKLQCRLSQIVFVLEVLVKNAFEASPIRRDRVKSRALLSDTRIRIEVEDEGAELTSESLERIFTPFYTTKPIGESIGMNLSLCRVIVEEQGGKMGFERRAGRSVFWFELILLPSDRGERRS